MAEHEHSSTFESGPTYKILFLGACAVIGAFIGWWFTDLKQSVTGLRTHLEAVDARDADLETGAAQRTVKIERLQRDVEDLSTRVREMERQLMGRR